MLRGGVVVLVLHLEHDRHVLDAVFALVAEDEVTFRAANDLVVFLEIGVGHDGSQQLVEERRAMDLERLAHHLRGLTELEVFVVLHLLLRRFELGIEAHVGLGGFLAHLHHRQLFLLLSLLKLGLLLLELRLQLLQLQLVLPLLGLQLCGHLRLLVLLYLMEPTTQLVLKLRVLHLVEQRRIIALINSKHISAMRTFQLFHKVFSNSVAKLLLFFHLRK